MGRTPTKFETAVDQFYAEAQRHGREQVALIAESAILVVSNCRPQLQDRWDELVAVLGPYSRTQLRLAGIAMRRLIGESKAAYIELSVDVEAEIRVTTTIDVVA